MDNGEQGASSSSTPEREMTRRPSATASRLRLELVHVKTCPSPQAGVGPPVGLISCGERKVLFRRDRSPARTHVMVMKASVGKFQFVGSQCNRVRGVISSRRTLRGMEGSFPLVPGAGAACRSCLSMTRERRPTAKCGYLVRHGAAVHHSRAPGIALLQRVHRTLNSTLIWIYGV